MRESVTINNITLTRAQIEAAVKELNTPEAPRVGSFGRTYNGPSLMMVIGPNIRTGNSFIDRDPSVVRYTDGHITYSTSLANWIPCDFAPAFTR